MRERAEADAITATYPRVQARDGICLLAGLGECDGRGEMNEHPSRAKTRGLPADQRFNTHVCCMFCAKHHRTGPDNFTAGTLVITFINPEIGFNGAMKIRFKNNGRLIVVDALRDIHYIEKANDDPSTD